MSLRRWGTAATRRAHDDLLAWLVVVVGSAFAGMAWDWRTRSMGDSAGYRSDALTIVDGWRRITARTPGYPLLLWLTGSTGGDTVALFLVQLTLHVATIGFVLDVLCRLGIGRTGRTVATIALMAPPPLLGVVMTQSEALSTFLLALGMWLFVRWLERPTIAGAALQGATLAAGVLVRPSYVVLVAPAAVALASTAPTTRRWKAATLGSAPAVAVAAALVLVNLIRFDYPGVTPLTGWYLGSRTSGIVDELGPEHDAARDVLVAERDRQLLLGDDVDAPNYSFTARTDLEAATGLSGTALDRYVLELNVGLITTHPMQYLDAVLDSTDRYVVMNSQPEIQRFGRRIAQALSLLHLVLAAAVLAVAWVVPGLALAGGIPRRRWWTWSYCVAGAVAVFVTSVLTETGAARLRTPTDPLIAVMTVIGIATILAEWRRRSRSRTPRP